MPVRPLLISSCSAEPAGAAKAERAQARPRLLAMRLVPLRCLDEQSDLRRRNCPARKEGKLRKRRRVDQSAIASAAFGLLAIALLAACGDAGQRNSSNSPSTALVATEAQNGASLTLNVGEELEVRLHGNETIDPPTAWSPQTVPPNLRLTRADILSDDPRRRRRRRHLVLPLHGPHAGQRASDLRGRRFRPARGLQGGHLPRLFVRGSPAAPSGLGHRLQETG